MTKYICNIYKFIKGWKQHIFFFGGLFTALFLCIAYFLIGTRSWIPFHDQLDGELLNYIYHAKYWGTDRVPEFMNGMHKSAMTPPAPIGVLFYKFLEPFWAFAFMHVFVVVVGYVGCFLLIWQLTKHSFISAITSCLFVYLPFYPVYGLSILGQPLLIWAFLRLWQKGAKSWLYFSCVFLYAISSSLALIGFAWVGVIFVIMLLLFLHHKEVKRIFVAWLILWGGYLFCNFQMIGQILGFGKVTYRLHRDEMRVVAISDLKKYFQEIFMKGMAYAESYNEWIVIFAVVIIVGYPILTRFVKREKLNLHYWQVLATFLLCISIAVFCCLWKSIWGVELRKGLGGAFKAFQADRVGWLLPVCWYVIFALCLKLLLSGQKKLLWVRYLVALVIIGCLGNEIYLNSTIWHNLRLMIFPNTYHLMNWDDYFACDVYKQVEEYIGEDKSNYRTLSLGITPAAALYNGFYCLDGYSNMYSLEYKHEFRKIIEKELEKIEETRIYFDEWGNRCYLFNSETGNYMFIDKNNAGTYQALELNMGQAYNMGARYLFSAMPIDNAEELGVVLMRETPFSTEESYFEVWLYEIQNME